MAEALGAQFVDMASFYGHLLSQDALHDARLWPYPTLDSLVGASILVSRGGDRFVDEGIGGVALSNALARMSDPLCATAIFDHATWETVGRADFTPPNPYLPQCGGTLVTALSIVELARSLDLPAAALNRSVDTFNAAVAAGSLASLTPPRSHGSSVGAHDLTAARNVARAIVQPPFHAIRVCAGLTYTMGGLLVDEGARVLDAEREPISGLYAAGSCVGGAEGGPRTGYLGGLCKALALGFIAAESIAAESREG
jgi:fumarate reductase flavoprotein subunit